MQVTADRSLYAATESVITQPRGNIAAIKTIDAREASAQNNDVWVNDVDNRGKAAGDPILEAVLL